MPAAKKRKQFSGTIAPLGDISSVQVDVLDAEHEQCAEALTQLKNTPTRDALFRVRKCYQKHFEHEESLLEEHLYGVDAKLLAMSRLSVKELKSLIKTANVSLAGCVEKSDLISRAEQVIRAAANGGGSGFSADDNMKRSHYADHVRLIQDIDTVLASMARDDKAAVPAAKVDEILRDFEYHANKYDDTYAERLSAALTLSQDL